MSTFEDQLLNLLKDDRDDGSQKLPTLEDLKPVKNVGSLDDTLSSLLGIELEDRPIEDDMSILFGKDDLAEDLSDEYFKHEMIKAEENVSKIDMGSENPNLEEEAVTELILIEGPFHDKVKDFLMNDIALPRGETPIAFENQSSIVMIKKINPEPKVLFTLQRVLTGFKLFYVTETEKEPLDINKFLGRPNLIK